MSYRVTRQHGFAPHHLLVVLAAVAGVVLVGFVVQHAVAVEKERKTYQEADQQITRFVDEASKLAPSTKSIERYCSRSSAKFEEGSLGCFLQGNMEYTDLNTEQRSAVMKKIDIYRDELGWGEPTDMVERGVDATDKNRVKSMIYERGLLTCGVHYHIKQNSNYEVITHHGLPILAVSIRCSGNALEEYY